MFGCYIWAYAWSRKAAIYAGYCNHPSSSNLYKWLEGLCTSDCTQGVDLENMIVIISVQEIVPGEVSDYSSVVYQRPQT